jgi:hypothetical protein
MKKIFIGLLFFTGITYCQDQSWQLFPPGELNHYEVRSATHEIRSFQCDSIRTTGSSTITYFRGHIGFSDSCYWQNRDFLSSSGFRIDSLVYNDSSALFYFREGTTVMDFRFNYSAKPGDEWNLSTHLSRKGYCVAVKDTMILGLADSMKIYVLESSTYGNVTIKLSKSFGLIRFIPFTDFFLEIPLNKTTIPYYGLIGFQNETESRGFQLPGFSDYFHLSAGDLLLWKRTFYAGNDQTKQYLRDSIKSSSLNPEFIYYNVHRQMFDNNGNLIRSTDTTLAYLKNDFGLLFNVPAGWTVARDPGIRSEVFFIDDIYFDYNDPDTAIKLSVTAPMCEFVPFNGYCNMVCLLDFGNSHLKFSTAEGLIYMHDYSVENELTLLGSSIFRKVRGTLEIPVGIEQSKICPIAIFPNPSSGIIAVTNSQLIQMIKIYNQWGTLLSSMSGTGQIDLSDQLPGCYYLYIITYSGDIYIRRMILIK